MPNKKVRGASKRGTPIVDNPSFDLNAYAAGYRGHTKVKRLIFIADRCPDVRLEAFRMAIDELKSGHNTALYMDTIARAQEWLGTALGDAWTQDQTWIGSMNRKSIDSLARLEANLLQLKKEGERDPTRVAYEKVALHHMQRGDFTAALTKFLEAKEYGTSTAHSLATHMNVMEASIHIGSLSQVKNNANRAQQLPQLKEDIVVASQVKAALGLYALKGGHYRPAAQAFLQCDVSIGDSYNNVLSTRDIAVYGALCALATYSRKDLKKVVLASQTFKKFFAIVPVWKEIILNFYNSKYADCFNAFDAQLADLRLDMYVGDHHVDLLLKKIRDKALVQYFRPFFKVQIPSMAAAFNLDQGRLEKMLVQLIADNKIQGRIDSHNKVLLARHADQRHATYSQVLSAGEKYARDTRSLLLRMSLTKNNNFSVRHPNEEKGGKGKGGRGRGRSQVEDMMGYAGL